MAVLFVVGAACFTVGGIASQWARTSRPAIGITFFVGTILFNVSTFAALRHNLSTHQTNARVWAPDVFGSVAFLVSSGI